MRKPTLFDQLSTFTLSSFVIENKTVILILKFHICLMAGYKLLSWRPTQEPQDGLGVR
jgi:hypothetical protein